MQSGKVTSAVAFEITTSLRWRATSLQTTGEIPPTPELELHQLDGIPLHYHRDRLLAAAKAFNFTSIIKLLSNNTGLAHLRSQLLAFSTTLSQNQSYKLRLTISPTGAISITASLPLPLPLYPFSLPSPNPLDPSSISLNTATLPPIYLSPTPTTPSLHTSHKTTNRAPYDALLSSLPPSLHSLPPTTAEILLFNPRNEITECIYSTPYFFRDGKLVTPAASCGGNIGVTRRLALERAWCVEGVVRAEELREGERVVVSNAVRGFWVARLSLELPKDVDKDGEGGVSREKEQR